MTFSARVMLVLTLCGSGCIVTSDPDLWKKRETGVDGTTLDLRVDAPRPDGPLHDNQISDGPWIDLPPPDVKPSEGPPSPDQKISCPHPVVVKSCTAGWCDIPPGCFVMGSATTEPCHQTNETAHETTLTHGFEIAMTEVTQGDFYAVMGYKPSANLTCGPACPAEMVTWHEAAAFCNTLSVNQSLTPCYTCSGSPISCTEATAYADAKLYSCPGYRLPTEAEWEYASRAGTATSTHAGDVTSCSGTDATAGSVGWYFGNSSNKSQATGQKQANAWGLYDMAGNVFEWINDHYQADLGAAPVSDPWGTAAGSDRVIRGGAFDREPKTLRAAYREPRVATTGYQDINIGFRCVRTK